MSDPMSTWLPGIVVLLVALALGIWAALAATRRRAPASPDDAALEDLEERREALLADLRDLETQRTRIADEEYQRRRAALESEAAAALRARDELLKRRRPGAHPSQATPAVTFLSARPQLRGFLYGAGSVAVLWLLWSLVTESAKPEAAMGGPAAPGMAGPASEPSGELGELVQKLHENPDDVATLVQVGHLLIRGMRLAQARPIVERALQLDPKNPESLVHLGMLTAADGDSKGAVKQLDAVIAEHPDFTEAWFFRGMIGMQTGNDSLKKESFTKYLALAPEGPQKTRVRAMLGLGGDEAAAANPDAPPAGARPMAAAAGAPISGHGPGVTVWIQNCMTCHGPQGHGDGPAGKALRLPDMADAAWQQRVSDDAIRTALRSGVVRDAPGLPRRMPAFKQLGSDDIEALVGVVRSLRPAN